MWIRLLLLNESFGNLIVSLNPSLTFCIFRGKLINCGQTCISPDYILVHKDIAKSFVEAARKSIAELLTCDAHKSPFYGRIINSKHFNRLHKVLEDQKKSNGSKLVFGGNTNKTELFIEPSLFTLQKNCRDDPIMANEIFGPLLPIIEVDDTDDGKSITFTLIFSYIIHQKP